MERSDTLDGLLALFGSAELPAFAEEPRSGQPEPGLLFQSEPSRFEGAAADSGLPPLLLLPRQQKVPAAAPAMEQLDCLGFDEILELFDAADADMPDFIGAGVLAPAPGEGSPAPAQAFAQQQQQQQQSQEGGGAEEQLQMLEALTTDLDIFGQQNSGVSSSSAPVHAVMTNASSAAAGGAAPPPPDQKDTASSMGPGPSPLLVVTTGLESMFPAEACSPDPDRPDSAAPPEALEPGKHSREGGAAAAEEEEEEERPSRGGMPDRMKEMADELYEMKNKSKAEEAALVDRDLEERLGVRMPTKTNVVTEFCDKHARQALEETIMQIEREAAGSFTDAAGVKVPSKRSIFGRVTSALGLGKAGNPAVAKPKKGGGRVRPKDQLQALEQALEALRREQADLQKEIEAKGHVVEKLDAVLNMKSGVMEGIKLSNIGLDSQLQETVQRQLVDQLGGVALEERGRLTSIPTIMMGRGALEASPALDSMLQNWKYSIERLSQVLSDASAAGTTAAPQTVTSIELQIHNIINFIINSLSSTAGASLMALVRHGLHEASAGNPNFVMEKYSRINSTIKCTNSQMKKLLALNKIFSSKIKDLASDRNKIVARMKTAVEIEHLSMVERAQELQRGEQMVQDLRLAYISMLEIRMLFNYTVLKKVLTPWQCGMCMIICYPMLPDPNFLSCAILNVNDLADIPWHKYMELVLTED